MRAVAGSRLDALSIADSQIEAATLIGRAGDAGIQGDDAVGGRCTAGVYDAGRESAAALEPDLDHVVTSVPERLHYVAGVSDAQVVGPACCVKTTSPSTRRQ